MKIIYITAPNKHIADDLAKQLVESQLVACVNMLPQMQSVYLWEGKTHKSEEIVMLCKTTHAKTQAVIDYVSEHHPYDVPAIFAIDCSEGNKEFLKWVEGSVCK